MMSQLLAGKVALITGGGRGMGRAMARAFAEAGAAGVAVIASSSPDEVAEAAGEISRIAGRDAGLGLLADVRENPQLAIYKAQTSAYKYSWMLIPLSVPFVWLLFPFSRRFRGYDHTVFVTYSITFMIALVAAASLVAYAGFGGIGLLLLLYAPFHMYRQLRGTYGLGRFGAVWRMLALSLFAWTAIGLFAAVILWMAGG